MSTFPYLIYFKFIINVVTEYSPIILYIFIYIIAIHIADYLYHCIFILFITAKYHFNFLHFLLLFANYSQILVLGFLIFLQNLITSIFFHFKNFHIFYLFLFSILFFPQSDVYSLFLKMELSNLLLAKKLVHLLLYRFFVKHSFIYRFSNHQKSFNNLKV